MGGRQPIRLAGLRSSGTLVLATSLTTCAAGAPLPWLATSSLPAAAIGAGIAFVVLCLAAVFVYAIRQPGWVELAGDVVHAKHVFLPVRRIRLRGTACSFHPWVSRSGAGETASVLTGPGLVIGGREEISFGCIAADLVAKLVPAGAPRLVIGPRYVVSREQFLEIVAATASIPKDA